MTIVVYYEAYHGKSKVGEGGAFCGPGTSYEECIEKVLEQFPRHVHEYTRDLPKLPKIMVFKVRVEINDKVIE